MIFKIQQHKYLPYLIHVFFWLLLILPVLVGNIRPGFESDWMRNRILISNLLLIALFYWNAEVLYYRVYLQRGLAYYLAAVVFSVLILSYGTALLTGRPPGLPHMERNWEGRIPNRPKDHMPPGPLFFHFPFYLAAVAASFSYSAIKAQNKREKLQKVRETELLKNELILLRSQISPHFMFNILNSLVSLARKRSELLEPSLIQLSTLMRYSLYDNHNGRIPLEKEINYLHDYLKLQTLRFGDELLLDISMPDSTEGCEIEPMLLIPFVENAFKHGVGTGETAYIKIRMSLSDGWLFFQTVNRIAGTVYQDETSGIGLKNIKRRLELLYPGKYELKLTAPQEIFRAELKLKLKLV